MERKSSKEYSVVFSSGRQKVQVAKFAFDDFIFAVGSAANSVGTTLEFAVFRSGPDPHNHDFYGGPNTFSQKNTHLFSPPNCDQ